MELKLVRLNLEECKQPSQPRSQRVNAVILSDAIRVLLNTIRFYESRKTVCSNAECFQLLIANICLLGRAQLTVNRLQATGGMREASQMRGTYLLLLTVAALITLPSSNGRENQQIKIGKLITWCRASGCPVQSRWCRAGDVCVALWLCKRRLCRVVVV